MRVLYGGVQIGEVNGARFTWGRTLTRNRAGVGLGFAYQANFSDVVVRSRSQAECAARMAAGGAALAAQENDLVVQLDDGSASDNAVLSSATLSGVRCTGLTWLDKPGAQFLTYRQFACSFEWETAFAGTAFLLVDFEETLTVTGGTPLIVVLEPINAPPIAQVTVPVQGYRATQSGSAVGYRTRPIADVVAPPLFPSALTRRTVTQKSPDRVGVNYRNWGVQWAYEYASATELVGTPAKWEG